MWDSLTLIHLCCWCLWRVSGRRNLATAIFDYAKSRSRIERRRSSRRTRWEWINEDVCFWINLHWISISKDLLPLSLLRFSMKMHGIVIQWQTTLFNRLFPLFNEGERRDVGEDSRIMGWCVHIRVKFADEWSFVGAEGFYWTERGSG